MNYLNKEICSAILDHQQDFKTGPICTVNNDLEILRNLRS